MRSLRSPAIPARIHRPNLTIIRHASSVPSSMPPMPPDMPREDYTAPTLYTLSYLSRIIKLIIYSALGISAVGLIGFEGLHLYIEHRLMATPSGPLTVNDPDEWSGDNIGWTGRGKGGTDPRLGWKARHALRGAWICQEWGAGGPGGTIGRGIHPQKGSVGVEVNRVDRGYELAEEYIDIAIKEAEKRGMFTEGTDPTAVDLMLLKAGVLERLATEQSLLEAKKVYQDVLGSIGEKDIARGVRLSGKIGDLSQRTGGDGMGWWVSGLQRAGVDLDSKTTPNLTPGVLRAVIGILISTEASQASKNLVESANIQQFALGIIPQSTGSSLQDIWSSHRRALLTLHSASVSHARKLPKEASDSATAAASLAESIIPHIPSPAISSPEHPSAKLLARDAQSLAAEANFTRGILLEKVDLEAAGECFEKAMNHAGERGPEWDRYWRGFSRVREKLEKRREAERVI